MKPLFRWTVGDSVKSGIDVLRESLRRTISVFGKSCFDWMVCSNAILNRDNIRRVCDRFGVEFFEQQWSDFPLAVYTARIDETVHCHNTAGYDTFWKICPPRLRPDSHEIVVDNDVVFLNTSPEIVEFLSSSDKVLMVLENASAHGKFFQYFADHEKYNSGILGFPPNYDFKEALLAAWEELGHEHQLGCRDEQGLVTYTLKHHRHVVLRADQVIQLLSSGQPASIEYQILDDNQSRAKVVTSMTCQEYEFSGNEVAVHFGEVNRKPHAHWEKYKRWALF